MAQSVGEASCLSAAHGNSPASLAGRVPACLAYEQWRGLLRLEDAVTSREMCDANLDDHYRRDFVLKQPSTMGPWVALGLGVTLLAFLAYLGYVNLLLPPLASGSPEHFFRPEVAFTSRVARAPRTTQRPLERRQPAVTVVPQGRAANTLLGGQGPALPPEHALTLAAPPGPHASMQAAAGRQ